MADRMAAAAQELSAQIEQSTTGVDMQHQRIQDTAAAVEEINRLSTETSDAMGQSNLAVAELAQLAQRLNTLIQDLDHADAGSKALTAS